MCIVSTKAATEKCESLDGFVSAPTSKFGRQKRKAITFIEVVSLPITFWHDRAWAVNGQSCSSHDVSITNSIG